jgi:predicted AAA+ superfamily ATPase
MLSKEQLKKVIIESKEQIQTVKLINRKITFEENMPYVLVGLRRVGKSYILYQRIFELIEKGASWKSILFINFEDERLIGFDSTDFNLLLEAHHELYNIKPILFLDEIQIINGWERFVRRVADSKHLIYISGSNAKMLSSEIATTLGGRFIIKKIYPYSLKEFLKAKGFILSQETFYSTSKKSEFLALFNEYFTYGALPETCNVNIKREYLTNVFQQIYLGDIILRNNIKNKQALLFLVKKIAESLRTPISMSRLTNMLNSIGIKVGKSTIIQYLDYMKDSFLIFDIKNINSKFSNKMTNPKYYFYDNGLLNLFLINQEPALLENLVATHLMKTLANEDSLFFYNDNVEIDFYIPEKKQAIQVSYSISNQNTYDREVNALIKFDKYKKGNDLYIITFDEEKIIKLDDAIINVIPIWKFILD